MIYFNFIIVNLTNMSFTIGIMTDCTVTVSCLFASIDNVSLLSLTIMTHYGSHWLYLIKYITIHLNKLLLGKCYTKNNKSQKNQ